VRNVCSIEGCEKFCVSHGWCSTHLWRWKTHGDPNWIPRRKWPTGVPCRVDECEGLAIGRGYCANHYQRWRTHGDPLGGWWRLPGDEFTKTCCRCKAVKDRSEFSKRTASRDGLRGQCKDCDRAYTLATYDPELASIKRRDAYLADLEKSRAYARGTRESVGFAVRQSILTISM
jgi:hypothetical protein